MKETELAAAVVDYFKGDYEVFKEVPAYGIIDIVAVMPPIRIGVECKTSFNLDVIQQADKNKAYVHYSYVAIPKPKTFGGFAERLCRERGIGVLTYHMEREFKSGEYPVITERLRPKLNRRVVALKLKDWQKESEAGCQSGRMTAFKNTVRDLVDQIKRSGGKMRIADAVKSIDHHYSNFSGAKASLVSRVRQGVIKELKCVDGYFIVNK